MNSTLTLPMTRVVLCDGALPDVAQRSGTVLAYDASYASKRLTVRLDGEGGDHWLDVHEVRAEIDPELLGDLETVLDTALGRISEAALPADLRADALDAIQAVLRRHLPPVRRV